MSAESGQVFEVKKQEGDRVTLNRPEGELSVPMAGFPPGFQLRAGERVVLVTEEEGQVARPLVRVRRGSQVQSDPAGLKVDNQPYAFQESSVREEGAGPSDVFIVDRGSASGPEQVIAVRRSRQQ
jgi:hypothetical protein